MKIYNHYFDTVENHDSEYNDVDKYYKPWTAFIDENDKVTYNKKEESSGQYLTFEIVSPGTIIYTDTENKYHVQYRVNENTWLTTEASTTINVIEGDKIEFKGNNVTYKFVSFSSSTASFNIKGNIMSLVKASNFENIYQISTNDTFKELFAGTKIVSAENLSITLDILDGNGTFNGLFKNCHQLVNAGFEFKIKYCIGEGICKSMFENCTSLTTTPIIRQSQIGQSCYERMFYNCTSLKAVNLIINSNILERSACSEMFANCTLLKSVPDLMCIYARRSSCYRMFYNCTSLTKAPLINFDTFGDSCCKEMFKGCISLTTIQGALFGHSYEKESCYSMFENCLLLSIVSEFLPLGGGAISIWENACTRMYANTGLTNLNNVSFSNTITVYEEGMSEMFAGCTSLTTPPALNAIITEHSDGCYKSMFEGCTALTSVAANTAPVLAPYCYQQMYKDCTSLATVADNYLPITSVAAHCYDSMFYGCTALTKMVNLPATILLESCYENMFYNCSNLVTLKTISATTLAKACCKNMFHNTKITATPSLTVTTMAESCYEGMFSSCTSLTTVNLTTAVTLDKACYKEMFMGCTALVNVPSLLCETLAIDCYRGMFKNCTNIVSAPRLYAETLVEGCYDSMFYGCTKLNFVEALFRTDITANTTYTHNWLYDVADTGNFVKEDEATWTNNGPNGIPINWNKRYNTKTPFTMVVQAGGTLRLMAYTTNNTAMAARTLKYTINGGAESTWTSSAGTGTALEVNTGDVITLKSSSNGTALGNATTRGTTIVAEEGCEVQVYGNMLSMINADSYYKQIATPNYAFNFLFCNRTNKSTTQKRNAVYSHPIRDVILYTSTINTYAMSYAFEYTEVERSAKIYNTGWGGTHNFEWCYGACYNLTTAYDFGISSTVGSCYRGMFSGCSALATMPNLPAKNVAANAYQQMFRWCKFTSLPQNCLPATTIGNNAYDEMFRYCDVLTNTPNLPAATVNNYSYSFMFANCTSLTNIRNINATTVNQYGFYGMFYSCTSLVNPPTITATTLGNFAMQGTFWKCTALTNIPNLSSITTMGTYAFRAAFYGCTALTSVSGTSMPNAALTKCCYGAEYNNNLYSINADEGSYWYNHGMFEACTSLVTAPALPATALVQECYSRMFWGCTSLVNAPSLPATTLAVKSYIGMFYNCTSLVNAPLISATVCNAASMRYMFGYCISMVNPPTLSLTSVGERGCDRTFFNCTSLVSTPTLNAMTLGVMAYTGMFYNCTSLVNAANLPATTMANYCYGGNYSNIDTDTAYNTNRTISDYGMFENCTSLVTAPTIAATTTASRSFCRMFANCTSLTTFQNEIYATDFDTYSCDSMFLGCTALTTITKLTINSCAASSFRSMYQNCSHITQIDNTKFILNATTVGARAFYDMFMNNYALTTCNLTFTNTTNSEKSWYGMFENDYSLVTGPVLSTAPYAANTYSRMFMYCYNLENIQQITAVCGGIGVNMFNCTTANPNAKANTFEPTNITILGGTSFQNCTGLNRVILPTTLTSVENNIFTNCTGILHFTSLTTSVTLTTTHIGNTVGNYNGTFHIYGDFNKNNNSNVYRFIHLIFEQNYTHSNSGNYFTTSSVLQTVIIKGNLTFTVNGGFNRTSAAYPPSFRYFEVGGTITSSWFVQGSSSANNTEGSFSVCSGHIVHLSGETVACTNKLAVYDGVRIDKIYVGDGSSAAHDSAILSDYLAAGDWADISSKLDTWYNYLHPNNIPAGYTNLEYVTTSGAAVVDTGIPGNNNNLHIWITCSTTSHQNWQGYFGNFTDNNSNCWRLCKASGAHQLSLFVNNKGNSGKVYTQAGNTYLNNYQKVFANITRTSATIIYNTATPTTTAGTANNTNIALGWANTSGGSGTLCRHYYFKVNNSDTPLLEYIPAKRDSDGAIGFYDRVTDTFITSTTATQFDAGPILANGPIVTNET